MTLTGSAFAKLNLTLDILGRRDDGYHEMRMVMQSVDLCDTVTVAERDAPGLSARCDLACVPRDGSNLAVKAARRFFESAGAVPPGLEIVLDKRIPVCAGLAGGSSDAAAVLRLLRRAYRPGISRAALEETGAAVGSDVPFCVRGGTALAEGRGERLTDLPALPPCFFVVCKPALSASTPELFRLADAGRPKRRPDTAGMLRALEEGDLEGVAPRLCNVFEEALPRKYAGVFALKRRLLELGAMAACMSGSGPAVFGLFREEERAAAACGALSGGTESVFLCRPAPRERVFPSAPA